MFQEWCCSAYASHWQRINRRAADVAKILHFPEHLGRAALEFADAVWLAWSAPEPAVRLLEEALRQLGEEDSALRARTLGSLARTLL
jgi:hypothetical protein